MTAHRWMAFVPYDVTLEDGLKLVGESPSPTVDEVPPTQLAGDEAPALTDARPFLGLHNVIQELVTVGCYECEQPLTAEMAKTDCPGDPAGRRPLTEDVEVRGGNVGASGAARLGLGGVNRNDPCPCGSGEKFKRCHGG